MEMESEEQLQPLAEPPNIPGSDVIVIKKNWLIATSLGLIVGGLLGGAIGFFIGVFAFTQGQVAATASLPIAVAQAPQAQAAAPQAQAAAPQAQAAAPAQAQPQAAAPATRLENISLDDDPFLGEEGAPIVIVEFSDFECPFCARFHETTFEPLMEEFGDQIQFVYRDFPLSQIHPQAQESAEAAECANDQGAFWEYHDVLFSNQATLDRDSLVGFAEELGLDVDTFTECLDSGAKREEVLADLAEGRTYGVTGTPTFFINGVRLVGAQPLDAFQRIIQEELDNN